MDLRSNAVTISVAGVGQLRSAFIFNNEDDTTKSYARKTGYVQFTTPPANLIYNINNIFDRPRCFTYTR